MDQFTKSHQTHRQTLSISCQYIYTRPTDQIKKWCVSTDFFGGKKATE